jgi:GNAT superfamily N-acetyltransferase
MPAVEIALTEDKDDPAIRVAEQGLTAFNAPFVGGHRFHALNLVVRRAGEAAPAGALIGAAYGGWLFIRYLFLPADLRGAGLGARLIARLEHEARARGCVGAWVDTFSFQARGFYERQGYRAFGDIPDCPPGHARHFLMKRLDRPEGATAACST